MVGVVFDNRIDGQNKFYLLLLSGLTPFIVFAWVALSYASGWDSWHMIEATLLLTITPGYAFVILHFYVWAPRNPRSVRIDPEGVMCTFLRNRSVMIGWTDIRYAVRSKAWFTPEILTLVTLNADRPFIDLNPVAATAVLNAYYSRLRKSPPTSDEEFILRYDGIHPQGRPEELIAEMESTRDRRIKRQALVIVLGIIPLALAPSIIKDMSTTGRVLTAVFIAFLIALWVVWSRSRSRR